jgi:transcriptional regulator with GAF, ATPase, and Fis domain
MSKKKSVGKALRDVLFRRSDKSLLEEHFVKLIEINTALNSELNLRKLLTLILDSVIGLMGAERGFLIRKVEDNYRVDVARNLDREEVRKAESKVSSGVIQKVLVEGQVLLTDSAMDDKSLSVFTSVADMKLRSILCSPLKIREEIIGCVYIDNRFQKGTFSEDDRVLLGLFCDQATIALENARLYEENEQKRLELQKLNETLEERVESQADEIQVIRKALDTQRDRHKLKYDYSNIVGDSQPIAEVFRLLDIVTDTDYPVLVYGQSGTGKELVARAIHYNGPRRDRNFVSENCAAISESLLESELFGYEKGAFTGADCRKIGLFEAADGGTLFLDEIGEMGVNMQKKLLRVLQEGEFRRVGGREALRVNVRIVSATNADLNKMIGEGTFREDFYYRIKVMTIRVPTLRERREDIPALSEFFMDRLAEETGVRKKIQPDALRLLMAHSWPGNVRELENETRRLHAISKGDITAKSVGTLRSSPGRAGEAGGDPFEGRTLEEIEKEAILVALKRAGGNKARAAKSLCIPRRTLYNRLKKYGIGLNGSD